MKKRGFTLVELLAVIAILAVLAIIAIPNILKLFQDGRKKSFENEVKEIIRTADTNWIKDNVSGKNNYTYSSCEDNSCDSELDLNHRKELKYYVEMDSKGDVKKLFVTDGNYQYVKNGDISVTDNVDADLIPELPEDQIITIKDNKVTQNGNDITVPSGNRYKCKRATTFHTETCNQNTRDMYCYAEGFTTTGKQKTATIKYGNNWTNGRLVAGDAFDCDVNGDNVYDSNTERFYYVSDYFNTKTLSYDSNYAALIYYKNYIDESLPQYAPYYATTASNNVGINYKGPLDGINYLPSNSTWPNVSLKDTTRRILGEEKKNHNITTVGGQALPTNFSYYGKAARLITLQEIIDGCIESNEVGGSLKSELANCYFLFENTKFVNNSALHAGYWTESVRVSNSQDAGVVRSVYRNINYYKAFRNTGGEYIFGIRPVIDVKKTDMEI